MWVWYGVCGDGFSDGCVVARSVELVEFVVKPISCEYDKIRGRTWTWGPLQMAKSDLGMKKRRQ